VDRYEPIADRIVVRPDEVKTETHGFDIPEDQQEKAVEGVIVAVGPGNGRNPMQTAVGDRIIYDKYSGQAVSIHGEAHVIMKENEALIITQRAVYETSENSTQEANI
jgi:chaperonin GroES